MNTHPKAILAAELVATFVLIFLPMLLAAVSLTRLGS